MQLWPCILTAAGIPCFLVPIKPQWAEQLFDYELARESLFAPRSFLMMNPEA